MAAGGCKGAGAIKTSSGRTDSNKDDTGPASVAFLYDFRGIHFWRFFFCEVRGKVGLEGLKRLSGLVLRFFLISVEIGGEG